MIISAFSHSLLDACSGGMMANAVVPVSNQVIIPALALVYFHRY